MLITREIDYALRILRALSGGQLRSIPHICQEEQIPKQFAYKILKKLSDAKLVQVTRGTTGGCRLSADLARLTLFDVISATGEDRLVNACTDCSFRCERSEQLEGGCSIHRNMNEIQLRLDELLREYTLATLLNI